MSGNIDHQHIFPFFRLPRELHDEIYKLATGDVKTTLRRNKSPRIHVIHAAFTDLLLLNRQTRGEYQTQLKGERMLVLQDVGWALGTPDLAPCSEIHSIPELEVRLLNVGECKNSCLPDRCAQVTELNGHLGWLGPTLAQFDGIRSLTIKVFVRAETAAISRWTVVVHHEAFAEKLLLFSMLPNARRVELYAFNKEDWRGDCSNAYSEHGDMLGKWTEVDGWDWKEDEAKTLHGTEDTQVVGSDEADGSEVVSKSPCM